MLASVPLKGPAWHRGTVNRTPAAPNAPPEPTAPPGRPIAGPPAAPPRAFRRSLVPPAPIVGRPLLTGQPPTSATVGRAIAAPWHEADAHAHSAVGHHPIAAALSERAGGVFVPAGRPLLSAPPPISATVGRPILSAEPPSLVRTSKSGIPAWRVHPMRAGGRLERLAREAPVFTPSGRPIARSQSRGIAATVGPPIGHRTAPIAATVGRRIIYPGMLAEPEPGPNGLKFVIWTIGDFSAGSGGGLALHQLANELTKLGHRAALANCGAVNPDWGGYRIDRRAGRDEIVIYPEGFIGNPMNARGHIVRWILFYPHRQRPYPPEDLLMLWSNEYTLPSGWPPVAGMLQLWRDFSHFQDYGRPRSGSCYALRKGIYRAKSFVRDTGKAFDQHPADALCVDRYDRWGGDDFLIRTFNEREIFITYDTHTLLPVLAACCGCPAVVIPDYRSFEQWSALGHSAGVAWGWSDLDRAKATLPLARDAWLTYTRAHDGDVAAFVETCRRHWGIPKREGA